MFKKMPLQTVTATSTPQYNWLIAEYIKAQNYDHLAKVASLEHRLYSLAALTPTQLNNLKKIDKNDWINRPNYSEALYDKVQAANEKYTMIQFTIDEAVYLKRLLHDHQIYSSPILNDYIFSAQACYYLAENPSNAESQLEYYNRGLFFLSKVDRESTEETTAAEGWKSLFASLATRLPPQQPPVLAALNDDLATEPTAPTLEASARQKRQSPSSPPAATTASSLLFATPARKAPRRSESPVDPQLIQKVLDLLNDKTALFLEWEFDSSSNRIQASSSGNHEENLFITKNIFSDLIPDDMLELMNDKIQLTENGLVSCINFVRREGLAPSSNSRPFF